MTTKTIVEAMGLAGMVVTAAGVIMITKSKAQEILKERKELIYLINHAYCNEKSEEENEEDRISSIKKAKTEALKKLCRAYAAPAAIGIISLTALAVRK